VLALGLVAAVCCLVASGCASFDKALGQSSVDVYFQQNVSTAYKMHVRAACNGLPNVQAEAIATGVPLASAVDVVVYNTTGASLVDITPGGHHPPRGVPEQVLAQGRGHQLAGLLGRLVAAQITVRSAGGLPARRNSCNDAMTG
jgi:hypothetical protein